MALDATILASQLDVTFGEEMTDEDRAAAWAVRDKYPTMSPGILECRAHDELPKYADLRCAGTYRGDRFGDRDGTRCPYGSDCGRVHGAWLYLRRIPADRGGGIELAHHPLSEIKSEGCRTPVGMADEHRGAQESLQGYSQELGWPARLEKVMKGCRADVFIEAPIGTLVDEVQWSNLTVPKARARDQKLVRAETIPVWTLQGANGPLTHHDLAYYATNTFPRRGDVPREDWWVVTPHYNLDYADCSHHNFKRCPDRRGGWCGGRHLHMERADVQFTVFEQLERLGSGATRRLPTGKTFGTLLVDAESYRRWNDEMPPRDPLPAPEGRSRPCTYDWQPQGQPKEQSEEQPEEVELPAPPPPGPAEQLALELPASSLPPGAGHLHPGSPAAHEAAEDFAPTALVMEGSRAYYAARRGWSSSASDRRLRESLTAAQLAYLDHLLAPPVDAR